MKMPHSTKKIAKVVNRNDVFLKMQRSGRMFSPENGFVAGEMGSICSQSQATRAIQGQGHG